MRNTSWIKNLLVNTLEFTHLKSPSSLRSEIESGQPHVDNCAENLESQQKSNKTESPAVSLPENPETVNSDHENNLIISGGVATEGLEKESYSRSPTVEEYHDISAVTDEFAGDCQVDDRRGFLLACELHSQSTNDLSKVGLDKISSSQEILSHTVGRSRTRSMNNSEMKTRRKLAYETPDREKHEVRASPQCMSFSRSRSGRLLMPPLEFWRNQRSIYGSDRTIIGIEEGRINPDPKIKVESGQPHVDNCAEDLESQQKSNKTESPAVSLPENPETVNSDHENNLVISGGVATEGLEKESYSRSPTVEEYHDISAVTDEFAGDSQVDDRRGFLLACELHSQSTNDLSKVGLDKISSPQENLSHTVGRSRTRSMNNSEMKTRRKLAYETPDREKHEVRASPQCMSFSRSRSGRLLMPPLEFWRNQRSIYGSDRTIIGIEEGRINPDPMIKGSPSTPRRKRKRKATNVKGILRLK